MSAELSRLAAARAGQQLDRQRRVVLQRQRRAHLQPGRPLQRRRQARVCPARPGGRRSARRARVRCRGGPRLKGQWVGLGAQSDARRPARRAQQQVRLQQQEVEPGGRAGRACHATQRCAVQGGAAPSHRGLAGNVSIRRVSPLRARHTASGCACGHVTRRYAAKHPFRRAPEATARATCSVAFHQLKPFYI